SCHVCAAIVFFQAEDGIRDRNVTGVQTCALPISGAAFVSHPRSPAPLRGARAPRATAEDRTWSGRWTGRPPLGSGGHTKPPPALDRKSAVEGKRACLGSERSTAQLEMEDMRARDA